MNGEVRRVTANLPSDLLDAAMEASGRGITETLVEGLRLVARTRAYRKALALRGRVKLDVDLASSRERSRRR
jgi:ATP-dependent DNA ligase